MDRNAATLDSILTTAAAELFHGYGLEARPVETPATDEPSDVRVATIIGFTGHVARGTLMLSVSEDALARSKAAQVADRDWLAELGNQLLGRLKNRLVRFDVDITMSTPLLIRGERLSPTLRRDDPPWRWTLPGGKAVCWLDMELAPGFELTERADAAAALGEGESLLF